MQGTLTPKQERFVQEYLVDLNAAQAAIRAGYSAKTAKEQGARLLTNVHVAAAVSERSAKVTQKLEVTVERVLTEFAKLAFANMEDFLRKQSDGSLVLDFSALTREQAAAIQEMVVEEYMDGKGEDARPVKRTKFKLHDKKGSLDSLAKYLGMFIERSVTAVGRFDGLDDDQLDAFIDRLVAEVAPGRGARREAPPTQH